MKILLLSHIGSVTGGAEQCLLEYVNVLIAQGHICKVIVPYKGPMTKVLTERKIPWVIVGYGWSTRPHRNVNKHRIQSSTGNSLVKIFQEVEKYKPQLIVTNTAVIPWGLYAGKMFNIPTILLAHEILSEKDPSLRIVPSYVEYGKILSDHADHIIYNSQFVRNEFKKVTDFPSDSEGILYPLPALDAEKIQAVYKENKIGSSLKIAIFGALSPRKNQLEGVKAIKELRDEGQKDFTLDLYGDTTADPSYTKTIRRYIRDNALSKHVKIKGFASAVYEKMNEYNVVLSTATYEPFGRTIIEGQLFGRIAVTNDTGGGLELVSHRKTGLIYHSSDPRDLMKQLKWIIANPKEAIEIGKTAKTTQLKKYLTHSRYDSLIEAVGRFESYEPHYSENIFDPMMSLFQYNHHLNNKYRHLYRLTHNRITYPIKGLLVRTKNAAKTIIKKAI